MKLAGPVVVSSAIFRDGYALRLQLQLNLANVGKRRHRLGVGVPAGVEGEDVLLEHTLEEADGMFAILRISQFCD